MIENKINKLTKEIEYYTKYIQLLKLRKENLENEYKNNSKSI